MKTLSKFYFFISLIVLSCFTMHCHHDDSTPPNKGEIKLILKTLNNEIIADAKVKLALSLKDLRMGFLLLDTTTDAKGTARLGVINAGSYYLNINCEIESKTYNIVKVIQIKPGERSDLVLYPESFEGKMRISLIENQDWDADLKIKISGLKLGIVPISDAISDVSSAVGLMKYAIQKVETDANGEALIEHLPSGNYRVLLYKDEQHPKIVYSTKRTFLVDPNKENNYRIPLSKREILIAEKKWIVQSIKDLNGNAVNLDYAALNFYLDGNVNLTSADGTQQKSGSYFVYAESNNLALYWKSSNSWNVNFDLDQNTMKVIYYEDKLGKTVIINLKN